MDRLTFNQVKKMDSRYADEWKTDKSWNEKIHQYRLAQKTYEKGQTKPWFADMGKDFKLNPSDTMEHCGMEGETCGCSEGSTVFFTRGAYDDGTKLDGHAAIQWGFEATQLKKGQNSFECTNANFGNDPHPGFRKQCFCEPLVKAQAFWQADSPDFSRYFCPGHIFMTKKWGENEETGAVERLTFDKAIQHQYHV
jgi:hypothetical protein